MGVNFKRWIAEDTMLDLPPPEYFEYGITRQWLVQDRIVLLAKNDDLSRTAVDAWWQVYTETVTNWHKDRPIAIIHDLTHPTLRVTPYATKTAIRAAHYLTYFVQSAFIASVYDSTYIAQLANFVLSQRPSLRDDIHEKIFRSREDALNWIQDNLHQSEASV